MSFFSFGLELVIINRKMKAEYIPYTYLIGWSSKDRWYYGVEIGTKRRIANPSNLWTTYFTSSKIVARMRKEWGEPDIIQIRRRFADADGAYRWEQTVLHRMRVISNNRWLNRAVYGKKNFSNDPERIRKTIASRKANGQPWHSEETRRKIGQANTGEMNLTVSERERRAQHLAKRNVSDTEFIRKNKEGRERRWNNPDERENQSRRMRDLQGKIPKRVCKVHGKNGGIPSG
jgi:hypothetical protein